MNKKLGLLESIPLGIGSIIGSGVLFLPSLTYQISRNDVLVSWIGIIILCIPGIFLFSDMVKDVNTESGMAGFVRLGLGDITGYSISYLVLSTVIIGMPSSAIIASDYLLESFNLSQIGAYLSGLLLIVTAIIINLFGLKTSGKINLLISLGLVITSIYIISKGLGTAGNVKNITPSFQPTRIYRGGILAFWAFAGFENMTFLYSKFKNPKKDLVTSIIVSLLICGGLYLGLVYTYSVLTPLNQVVNATGLMDMGKTVSNKKLFELLISIFALMAVLINLISWTGGVSELVKSTLKGVSFSNINSKASTLLLGAIFVVSFSLLFYDRGLMYSALELVSMNFLIVYALGVLSYVFYTEKNYKRIIGVLIVLGIIVSLSSSGLKLVYPLGVFVLSGLLYLKFELRLKK